MRLHSKIATLFVVSTLFLSSCYGDFEPVESTDQWVTTHTIGAFINEYVSEVGDLPARIPGLFSVDTIPANKNVIINGVVISNDNEGNIYKYIVIQDYVSGRALKVSVDAGNLSAVFPTGRAISINCKGLAIGRYADMLQLGIAYYKTESGKVGYEIGRIPYPLFLQRVQINETSPVLPISELVDTVTIAEIINGGVEMHNKLVCIKNAYFTGNGADYGKPKALAADSLKIFAPSTNGIGFPQSREIQDGTGSIFIATSEYSKFAKYKLPESTNVGNITALVGWYNDKDLTLDPTKIYHQLTLRSITDLGKGYERYHHDLLK